LHAVEAPVLTSVTPPSAAPGSTVTLVGANFSPVAEQNVVLFSGVRGRVLSSTGSQMEVEVPACLPARDVAVSAQLGAIASGLVSLIVTEVGEVTSIPVGGVIDVADDEGFACYQLDGSGGAQYLALVYSASDVGAAMHPYELTALSSSAGAAVPPLLARRPGNPDDGTGRTQAVWEERIRALEGGLIGRVASPTGRAGQVGLTAAPARVPAVGEQRVFSVLTPSNDFEQITAEARYVGTEAAIFVDRDAPPGGFKDEDLGAFAARFDEVIHPEVTGVFGDESDLDGNERVIILFTPAVNRLTPRGASGFIGGYFFGNDLIPENEGSNAGEVFYALVPDPTGIHSDPRVASTVLNVVPAVLAHEFQHMVHFNVRYLGLDAGQEALWLSEGLAQMAEELVARRYEDLGDAASVEIFRAGARSRAARYLSDTESVSVIVSTGQGSLGERGAGFLHVLYLADQEGIDVLEGLTSTTRKGVLNVEAQTGRDWPDLVSDWWTAIYVDGPGPESGPRVYPDVDLKGFLGSPYPLVPEALGPGTSIESGLLWSSGAVYFLVSPVATGTMTLRLGGDGGGRSGAQAVLRLRIVRVA
jgi:hypothetical protein